MGVFVGIDVSKKQLDVALRPSGERFEVENNDVGIARLMESLQTLKPSLVIFESTGGYERDAAFGLAAVGLPVLVVNARQIRDFARATGRLAKTDKIDAEVIARFGEVFQSEVRELLT